MRGCCHENHSIMSGAAGGISMAITVNLRYPGKDSAARKFAEEMTASGTVAAIRTEAGNLRADRLWIADKHCQYQTRISYLFEPFLSFLLKNVVIYSSLEVSYN